MASTAEQLVAAARQRAEESDAGALRRRAEVAAANLSRGVLAFQVETHPVLACRTAPERAWRAILAAEAFRRMGFPAGSSLAGGFRPWPLAGHPVTREG